MKCFGDAEESLGSSAADASHRFLSLEVVGEFSQGRKFWEQCEQGHLGMADKYPHFISTTNSSCDQIQGYKNICSAFLKLSIMDFCKHTQEARGNGTVILDVLSGEMIGPFPQLK